MQQQPPLTDDQAAGVVGLCCFLFVTLGLLGFALYMLSRRAKHQPPPPGMRPPSPDVGPQALHLSVLALAVDLTTRLELLGRLSGLTGATAEVRTELARRAAQGLLEAQAAWLRFGYGEKPLGSVAQAEQSYLAAVSDFRARTAGLVGSAGPYTVATLIIATRGPLAGVSRLDDPAQVRAALEDRARLEPARLLGAELLWAPEHGGLSAELLATTFPEMQSLHR
jgi:uncharacterized membrane protein